jgi:hypothetical protein
MPRSPRHAAEPNLREHVNPEPEDGGVRENGTDASGRGGLDTAGRPACVKGTVAMPAATRTPPSVLWICLACMTADGYDVVSYGAVLPTMLADSGWG